MTTSQEPQTSSSATPVLDYDVIIIGAGMSGMSQLLRLRELGMRVRVFEAGTGVGGTWYWNRYPGARFDSESYSYSYSFSKELLEEWNWSEHFAGQPETLRYLNYAAMFQRCQETFSCFLHTPDPRGTFEGSDAERETFFEQLYAAPGFGIWQGNFRDILTDRQAHAAISAFVARKIRQQVSSDVMGPGP